MKNIVILMIVASAMLVTLHAQEHLVPDVGPLAEYDEYYFKVGEIFAAAQHGKVVCKVIIIPSFAPECSVGIRESAKGYEVFTVKPSSPIWDIELMRLYESGKIKSFNKDGSKLKLRDNESYQNLKKRTPENFGKITTTVKAAAIDTALAQRIAAIWERMLLAVRQPQKPWLGCDGVSYHFSMYVSGRGVISGQIWSPEENTGTAALVELSDALFGFITGRTRATELMTIVGRVEKLPQV